MNINQVTLVGRLTHSPELKTFPSGNKFCTFTVATSRTWIDKTTNEKREQAEFSNVNVFGKLAEVCAQYLVQGQLVGIQGYLKTDKYEKNGANHYATKIIAESVQFGAKPAGAATGPIEERKAAPESSQPQPKAEPEPVQRPLVGNIDDMYPRDPINASDIPF